MMIHRMLACAAAALVLGLGACDHNKKKPEPVATPAPAMGVAELEGYIEELRAEIARAEADILKKGSARAAADAFFKKT